MKGATRFSPWTPIVAKGATLFLWVLIGGLIAVAVSAQTVEDRCLSPAPPDVIVSPSSVGNVTFAHQMHSEDLEIPCAECHHETDAVRLQMPHQDYLQDFWIDCTTCHHESETPACPQACSTCHHSAPHTVADETMSAKVVIHQSCWKCHEVATGSDASRNCSVCHQGAATPDSEIGARHIQPSSEKEVER
ncbi:MAG: hypothetical protein GWP16_00390 [Nitrospirae bacterium]|nr:hypothetical protein [Nitrospirota bacterium]